MKQLKKHRFHIRVKHRNKYVQKFHFTYDQTLHFKDISDLFRYNIFLETFNDILKEGRR